MTPQPCRNLYPASVQLPSEGLQPANSRPSWLSPSSSRNERTGLRLLTVMYDRLKGRMSTGLNFVLDGTVLFGCLESP